MTWSAFFHALRTGMLQRGAPGATRRTGGAVVQQQRATAAARGTSTQATKGGVPKKKTMEDWDYRCIELAMAWH